MHSAIRQFQQSLRPGRLTQLARQFNARPILEQVIRDPEAVRSNAAARKSWVNIDEVQQLVHEAQLSDTSTDHAAELELPARLNILLKALPNSTCESVRNAEEPVLLEEVGVKRDTSARRMVENAKGGGLMLQNAEYSLICGERTYILTGDLVRLERALVRFTLDRLQSHGFRLVSVPDLVTAQDIEACGMVARGKRSQIYHVNLANGTRKLCLSGTAEMALANLYKGRDIPPADLPLKLCSVSRCYRAEVSTYREEKGLYRVHQFTKVEMFGITEGCQEESQKLQKEFFEVERSLFADLGLHFKVLDMPPHDLGSPAFRKIDIEAWMSGHKFYGEISSTSDCTSYQANRLGITSNGKYVHTVNGTACAVPRMLIALGESHVKSNGIFLVPPALRPYLDKDELRPEVAFRRWKYLPFYYFENRLLDDEEEAGESECDVKVELNEKSS